jgi:haloacetate dehalogenase
MDTDGEPKPDFPQFFPGFRKLTVAAGGVRFRGVVGGAGPAVLLLHGYPQTHVAWRHVAPRLADAFTVVVPDLPGYGDSVTQSSMPRWTKRRVSHALIEMMDSLGHSRFSVVGHDRGARVGYRLALDHPARAAAFASLTVAPTLDAWATVDKAFAMTAPRWFMLAQPMDLPERMLSSDPDGFLNATLDKMAGGLSRIEPAALDAYRAAFRRPSVRHAICEDYRAAAGEDAAHDATDRAAGRKLACPVLALWPERRGRDGQPTLIDVWRRWADDVSGVSIPGGHLQAEESPQQVLAQLLPFLAHAHARTIERTEV